MDEILKDVDWRGNLEMATEVNAHEIAAISYGIFGGPFNQDARGDIVWAIFVDRKFQKFVLWPDWGGATVPIGDFSGLIRTYESDALNLRNMAEQAPETAAHAPDVDLGLTVVWLLNRERIEERRRGELERNEALRDQFNASRLQIGMSEKEVEELFGSQPLETGEWTSGTYKIFGSDESFDIMPHLHYANVMILFVDGKLIGVYSGYAVPGGEQWRNGLQSNFHDLPTDGSGDVSQ
jgi:hypothetical protein